MAAPSPDKLRRVLSYWAATAVLYVFCAVLVFHEISEGLISPGLGWTAIAFPVVGLGIFYILIRTAHRLGIPNWRLAYSQAIFAIAYDLLLYVVLQHVHAAILIGLPVIIVFCAFALRPRQTVALAALGIGGLAVACAALAVYGDGLYPAELEFVNFALTAFGVVSVTVVTSDLSKLRYRLSDQKRQLEDALAKIESVARTDELTALANRRRMTELLDQEELNNGGAEQEVCVALIDIDHFKSINDRLGHAGGDAVLQAFARICRRVLRANDTLARWGGEEFLLLMPSTRIDDAEIIVKRILDHVRSAPFPAGSCSVDVTFSAGVVERMPSEKMALTLLRADAAMYAAKGAGRNCVSREAAKQEYQDALEQAKAVD